MSLTKDHDQKAGAVLTQGWGELCLYKSSGLMRYVIVEDFFGGFREIVTEFHHNPVKLSRRKP